jgi:hypothetical protein
MPAAFRAAWLSKGLRLALTNGGCHPAGIQCTAGKACSQSSLMNEVCEKLNPGDMRSLKLI